jgi:glycosyltransferase involved in cell wall biosynthesis
MKVAHVITRMIVGGAQENTLSSVQGLAAIDGYELALLTGPETGTEGDLLAGVEPNFELVYVPPLVRAINPVADARALAWLTRWFRARRPDVVHTHSSKAGVVGRIAARRAGVPLVVHTLHSLVFHDYQPAPVRAAYRQVKRLMVPFTDHYVSVSDDIRRRAVAAGIGVPEHHSTIRSGFDTDAFVGGLVPRAEARARLGLPDDRIVVGVVGRLFPLKGHEEIVRAATRVVRRHPDVLFAFVGSGPLEPALRDLVGALGLDGHVAFAGRVPPAEVPVAFSAFDVLAHASLREGLARVIPQGVLAGVPVVCYDLDGSREVVRDGENGFLVPPRDVPALADCLGLVLGDDGLRRRMGGVHRDRIREEFSVESMVRSLDDLYGRLGQALGSRTATTCS